jgi:RNA polymerase sigma factor (sigma-70 family)
LGSATANEKALAPKQHPVFDDLPGFGADFGPNDSEILGSLGHRMVATAMSDKPKISVKLPTGLAGVFVAHQSGLLRFISRFFTRPQDIEDVAQEAYLRAIDAEASGETVRAPKAFLFRIAKHVALNELARKSRLLTEYIEDSVAENVLDKVPTVDEQLMGQEKLALFCRAVASLPAQCRKAFLMRKVYGMSHKDIAEQLGISRSTVEKHIASGLLRCSAYMREGGYPVDVIVAMESERRSASQGEDYHD